MRMPMLSERSKLREGVMRLAARLMILPGVLALLLLLTGPGLAAPCHDMAPDAAPAHVAAHAPATPAHPAADQATMGLAPATADSLPCTGHVPGASCCGAASCAGIGWTPSSSPPCPAPSGAPLASGHAPPATGGPGTPRRPGLPPPRRA